MVRGQFDLSKIDHLASGTGDSNAPLEAAQTETKADDVVRLEGLAEPDLGAMIERQAKPWGWLKLGIAACTVLGGIAGAALLWILSLPPAVDCQKISALSPDMERLYCAQEAARSGELPKLLAGMKTLEQWTPDNPLYGEAQRLMGEWSNAILNNARRKMEQNDYKGAVELAKQIPKSSPSYAEAQTTIAEWQQHWRQFERIYAAAHKALKEQNWEVALQQIINLREADLEYWRSQQANALSQRLSDEKQAHKLLSQARTTAQANQPEQLSAALTLLSQINPKTYAWEDAQKNLQQWSETLLSFGLQQWQRGFLDQAIALAKRVTLNPNLAAEAENLIWLSHASKLRVSSASTWETSPSQLLKLMGAMTIAAQIQPESRFYPQAQASLKNLQVQAQAVTQLQTAQLIANLGHPATLNLAAAQGRQISANSPLRLQAQTLVAHWTREAERIEDRPYLAYARQLAERGTIDALQSAINQANRVLRGRALYGEAQSLMFAWNQQVETLEDQPTLLNAQGLARQGRLTEAIQTAARIRPGRALFLEAQAAINDWETEIRNAEIAARNANRNAVRNGAGTDRRDSEAPSRESRRQQMELPAETWENLDPDQESPAPFTPRFSDPPSTPQPVPDNTAPPFSGPSAPAPTLPTPIAPASPPPVSAPEPIEPTPPSLTVPTKPVEPPPPPPAGAGPQPAIKVPASFDTDPTPTDAPLQEPGPISVNLPPSELRP
jgi:hypothetical protein